MCGNLDQDQLQSLPFPLVKLFQVVLFDHLFIKYFSVFSALEAMYWKNIWYQALKSRLQGNRAAAPAKPLPEGLGENLIFAPIWPYRFIYIFFNGPHPFKIISHI